jgi:hypothetical protein
MTNFELTSSSLQNFPNQVPPHFRIYPLPAEVDSWVYSILQPPQRYSTDERSQLTKKRTWSGQDGSNSSTISESTTTSSLTGSTNLTELQSPQRSFNPSDQQRTYDPNQNISSLIKQQFLEGLSEIPPATWLRGLDNINDSAHSTFKIDRQHWQMESQDYLEPGPIQTHQCVETALSPPPHAIPPSLR